MRRYFFYFAFTLLGISFALFTAIQFSKFVEQAVIAQTSIEKTSTDKTIIQKSKQAKIEDENLYDEEKASFEVLQPTIKKWLRGEKVKNEFTDVSDESIKKISGKSKSDLTEDEAKWYSSFRFEPMLIDVNGNGKKELAVRNNCAPVGNCQFWLFKKKGNDYQIILKTLAGAVQTFKLQGSKTKSYFDIETKDHNDAWSGGIEIYKFDGEIYKVAECFNYNYSDFKNGKLYELKKPKITSVDCNQE